MKRDKLSVQLPRNVFPAIRFCSKMKTVKGNIFLSVFTSLVVVRLTLNREAVDEVREHWEGSSPSCWEQACSADGGRRGSWETKLGSEAGRRTHRLLLQGEALAAAAAGRTEVLLRR